MTTAQFLAHFDSLISWKRSTRLLDYFQQLRVAMKAPDQMETPQLNSSSNFDLFASTSRRYSMYRIKERQEVIRVPKITVVHQNDTWKAITQKNAIKKTRLSILKNTKLYFSIFFFVCYFLPYFPSSPLINLYQFIIQCLVNSNYW